MNREDLLRRVATLKTDEVEHDLPRIHLETEGALFQLMVWRNKNKDKVRAFKPVIKEGVISMGFKKNFFYFLQSEETVYIMNKISNEEYIAIMLNTTNSTVRLIKNTITFYPEGEAIQDLITIFASTMAYLTEIKKTSFEKGETFTIENII